MTTSAAPTPSGAPPPGCARCGAALIAALDEAPLGDAPELCAACCDADSSPQLVMVSQPPPAMPRCRRVSYIVLGLLFGALGIHNFVAGRSGRAIAQLLVTFVSFGVFWRLLPIAVVGVWALVEVCVVDTDCNGVPMG